MHHRKVAHWALIGVLLFGLAAPMAGWAKPGQGKGGGSPHQGGKGSPYDNWGPDRQDFDDGRFSFTHTHRGLMADMLLRQYANRHGYVIDPLLLNTIYQQAAIPPGVQMNLMRGKPLPPGIAKKVVWLPDSVNYRLGLGGYPNYRLGVFGRDVFLYNTATGLILDILEGIIND